MYFSAFASGLRHFDFGPGSRPTICNRVASAILLRSVSNDSEQKCLCLWRGLANDIKLLACRFALCVFLYRVELPGDICHHCVDIISRF